MSANFESLKKLDQKSEREEAIPSSEPLPVVGRTSLSARPQKWVVLWLIALGVGWVALALFGYFKYQEISEILSAQHSSFVSGLDQLAQEIDGLGAKLVSVESGHEVVVSRLKGISERADQERRVLSEAIARHDELIAEQKNSLTQLDERLHLLSQQIGALAESLGAES